MNKTNERKLSGVTYLTPELAHLHKMQDNDSNEVIPGFGGNGGGGMDNLDRRVTALEDDVKVIRKDLTTLTVRSENFATKADISDIRVEIASLSGSLRTESSELGGSLRAEIAEQGGSLRAEIAEQGGSLRAEMAAQRGEIKAEMAALRGELKTEMSTQSGDLRTELQKAINKQTLLLLTVIPAAFALVTFLFDYFKR